MNTIDQREMLAICGLAQKAGPAQLKRLSQEERKVVGLMVKALSKGKDSITTDLDIRVLKEHLLNPQSRKASTRGEKIIKGVKNVFTRISSTDLSREIDRINPLNKSPQEVRQAQIDFHTDIMNQLQQQRENLIGRKEGILGALSYYGSILKSKDQKDEIGGIVKEISGRLPKQPPKDPVAFEKDKLLRQLLPVLEHLKMDTNQDRKAHLQQYIHEMDDLLSECMTEFTRCGELLRQEDAILRKLQKS